MVESKYFTPHEAGKTLPLVKRIVRDILDTGRRIRMLSLIRGENRENTPEIEQLGDHLNAYFAELEELGCYYKDWNFSIGLVDFPAIIDDREVLLCWRSDEERLEYYHTIEAGYAGRKRIPGEYLTDT
jgi:hypothetical protein